MADPIKKLPILPAERTLKLIAGRWKPIVIYYLLEAPRRLSELRRLMPEISQKVLVQQLRELEAHGILRREVFRQVPPRVEYSATPLGRSLEGVLMALCDWGRSHAMELDELDRLVDCTVRPPRWPGRVSPDTSPRHPHR